MNETRGVEDDSDQKIPNTSGAAATGANTSKLISYLQLFRAPNVFTAIADVAMGYLVTSRSVEQPLEMGLIVLGTTLLYSAGMVLNDVFDFDVDRIERPQRPLPSGRISRTWARNLGFFMLVTGVLASSAAGMISSNAKIAAWRPLLIATLLAGCIVAYDAWAKKSSIGALFMGSCRFLNVLLGMSLYAHPSEGSINLLHYGPGHLMIAAGIGIYIVGVTVFARGEVSISNRNRLILGVVIIAIGIGCLAAFPTLFPTAFDYRLDPIATWPIAMLLISFWIFRRCIVAIFNPEPMYVQGAIKFCLVSLIILDATLCLLVCPPPYALGIMALLIPTMTLGRWVYST